MRSIHAFTLSAVVSAIAATSGSAQSHGDAYDLLLSFEGLRLDRQAAAALNAAPNVLAADSGADEITSFFVNIYDASESVSLSVPQNVALAHAIGSADRDNLDNTDIPAGFTFLGQFIDHDVTLNELRAIRTLRNLQFQVVSLGAEDFIGLVQEVLANERSSLLDLDSVYGLSLQQLEGFIASAGSDQICPTGRPPIPGCIDLTALDPAEARAIAAYERDAQGRLTGRLRVTFRASSIGGPIFPDLPRCADDPALFNSPACSINSSGGEVAADVLHRAVIGDGRNDENVIIAQIHAIFLMAHNRLYDAALAQAGVTLADATVEDKLAAFREARHTLNLHWQALVMDDYLTEHVGREAVDAMRTGPLSFYTTGDGAPYCEAEPGAMPHEFAVGAFRHGHSQVRPGYLLNRSGGAFNGAGFLQLFGNQPLGVTRMVDFRGFFDGVTSVDPSAAEMTPAPTQAIDTVLSRPLGALLAPSIPADDVGDPVCGDLSARNTTRAGGAPISRASDGEICIQPVPLVSGLEAAEAMADAGIAVEPLTDMDVASLGLDTVPQVAASFPGGVRVADLPLWTYVLAEAEVQEGGQLLGSVGATIIGETLVGLIRCDADGVLSQDASFEPTMVPAVGLQEDGRYRMADLINFALER